MVPWLLILFRLVLGPCLLASVYLHPLPGYVYALAVIAALVSDFFDGVLARRAGTATTTLRLWDSWADLSFWLWAAATLWVLHPDVVGAYQYGVIAVLVLEFVPDMIYWARFRQQGCSHSYHSKLWGVTLVVAFTYVFMTGTGGWPFALTVWLGISSQLERVLIACLLPARICDIPTVYHAWQLRRGREIRRNPWFHGEAS